MAKKKTSTKLETKGSSKTKAPATSKAPAKSKGAAKAKSAATPKTAAAKATSPATTIKISLESEAAEIVREIVEIAQRIDESGLDTLLNAARAVETKGKIERFNRELNVAADQAARKRREHSVPEFRVLIEPTNDGFFVIQMDDVRVFFNRQELREITRLCHASRDAGDAARRMFRWFERERSDLLADAGINSEQNSYLTELYEQVIRTYKVKTPPTK